MKRNIANMRLVLVIIETAVLMIALHVADSTTDTGYGVCRTNAEYGVNDSALKPKTAGQQFWHMEF